MDDLEYKRLDANLARVTGERDDWYDRCWRAEVRATVYSVGGACLFLVLAFINALAPDGVVSASLFVGPLAYLSLIFVYSEMSLPYIVRVFKRRKGNGK